MPGGSALVLQARESWERYERHEEAHERHADRAASWHAIRVLRVWGARRALPSLSYFWDWRSPVSSVA